MESVADWLTSLGLGEHAQCFSDNDLDGSVLRDLTDADLKDLGISLGHRKKILRAIAELGPPIHVVKPGTEAVTVADSAERRQLTLMFCDLVGSTALSARLDPEDMREVILAYQNACAHVIHSYDGFIAKFMGDGILAYFGYPRAHEDDAARAVRAGLEIIAAVARLKTPAPAPLKVRTGIATGLVVVGDLIGAGAAQEQTVVGETPNLAARLQAVAEPGQVVVGPTTRRLLGGSFKLRDLGCLSLKGFAAPVNAWAVEAALAPASRFEADHAEHRTGFVGREAEVGLLAELRKRAWLGDGQVVLVTGEAGIGKSCIAERLRESLAGQPHTQLRYQCSPYHRNSALHPVIGQVERAVRFAPDDSPAERLDKLERVLALSVVDVRGAAPLFAALLAIPVGDRYPPLGLSPAEQRRRTFAAMLDQLQGFARQGPVLLVFEDAQWADATSLEVLDLTIRRVRGLPVLAVITFRPEFEPPWTGLPHVHTMGLARLDAAQVEALVERVAGARSLPREVMDQILAKTDGIPLFVEELTKTVIEAGILVEEDDHYSLQAPLLPFAIPTTLHDSLTARLDRLAPIKEIAQIGAAIGREFSYALLRSVTGRDEATLGSALAQLEEAELLFRRGTPPDADYTFKHALVRDTAYEGLLKSRRQVLHARIAEALREHFPTAAEIHPEVVARHFTQAGLAPAAIEWWGKAGDQALRRSAYIEAIAHFGKAIDLAEAVSDVEEQRRLRLRPQVALGNALIHSRGLSAPEAKVAFARARELAMGAEDADERFSAYYGLWVGSSVRCELATMREVAAAFLIDAERRPDSVEAGIAHRIYGATRWYEGDFAGARPHLERAAALYDPERDRPLALRYGQDIGVSAMMYLALALWPLGEWVRARHFIAAALALADDSGHAPTRAYAHGLTCLIEGVRDAPADAAPHAELMLSLGDQHGLRMYTAIGTFHHGWTRWHAGDRQTGEADMERGLVLQAELGFSLFRPTFAALRSGTQAQAGRIEAALAAIEEALGRVEGTGERWFEAELHRRRGELLARRAPGDASAAESAFRRALDVSRSQHARAFELRAALGLARLYLATDRREAACELLAPALAGFTETPELPEVAQAGRLLACAGHA